MSLEVKIRIRSIVKKKPHHLPDEDTHDFIVSVQGLNGNHIEHFIKQVVFYLPFNSNSKRVRSKPPYIISGSTRTSFRLPIFLLLNTSENFRKVKYTYYLFVSDKPEEKAVCVKSLKFLNTPPDFRERLLLGGAEVACNQNKSKTDVTHFNCKSEPTEIVENQNVNILEEAHNQLPDACVQNQDNLEQNSSFIIQNTFSFDELLKENETLKKENETLNKKLSNQESVIAIYAERLPTLQNSFSAVNTDLNELKPKAEANEAQISNLKSSIQMLMSKFLQHKDKISQVRRKLKGTETSAALV